MAARLTPGRKLDQRMERLLKKGQALRAEMEEMLSGILDVDVDELLNAPKACECCGQDKPMSDAKQREYASTKRTIEDFMAAVDREVYDFSDMSYLEEALNLFHILDAGQQDAVADYAGIR